MKRQKGITLIALVITIIVLLILVGVTITMLTGENGILNQATKSTIETYHGTVKEQIILGADEYFTAKNVDGYKEDVIKYLLNEKSYTEVVDDYYRVKVEKVASTIKTGKGKTKAEGDIYVIEKENTTTAQNTKIASTVTSDIKVADTTVGNTKYVLRYYEKENKSKDLLYLYANGTIENPDTNPNPDPDPDPDPVPPIPDPVPEVVDPKDGDTVISYVEDLVNLQTAVNGGETQSGKRFILNNDLDFTDINSYDPSDTNRETLMEELTTNGFITIGKSKSNQYEGEFYGNGHTIKNINLKNENSDNIALFAYNKGKISSLIIENAKISGGAYIAVFATYNNGTVEKCTNKSSFEKRGYSLLSGIVGYNNGTVTECKNEGNLNGNTYTAGIIGNNSSTANVLECKNTGNINGSSYVAGIVGYSNATVNILSCENSGNINAISGCVGGIIGEGNGTIKNCINDSTIISSSSSWYFGGIAGKGTFEISKCVNKGTIDGGDSIYIGGILGCSSGAIRIDKCKNEATIKNGSTVGGILGRYDRSGDSTIASCYNLGLIEEVSVKNKINIGGIVGELNDSGLLIENCYNKGNIIRPSNQKVGGILGDGYSNSTITNVYNVGEISGNSYTGGIIGYQGGSSPLVNKAYNTGKITGNMVSTYDGKIGGIVGGLTSGSVINVYNSGEVIATQAAYVGGVAGECYENLSNAQNTGSVTGDSYVGGVTGYSTGTIKNVYNTGTVTGNTYVGIILGVIYNTNIENAYYLNSLEGELAGKYNVQPTDKETIINKIISKPETEMKSQTFVELLNANKANIENAVNWKLDKKTGYPIPEFTVTI